VQNYAEMNIYQIIFVIILYKPKIIVLNMKNELDSKDIQILSLLLNNARLSNKEIAAKIEIAQSSAHDRIKKLT